MKPIVVVIDTNVWVSAFLNPSGFPAQLVAAGKAGLFTVVSSLPLLDELFEVLSRPRIMKIRQTAVADAEEYVKAVAEVALVVSVSGDLRICRDRDDDILIETALAGNARYLVSRDDDVARDLELTCYLEAQNIQALTVSKFLAVLAEA